MPEINIQVRNKIAVAEKAVYICGNSDFVVNFDFDSEWNEYQTKTARFTYEGRYTDVVFTGNQCEIPVISDTYKFSVGVFAGDLHTTTPARVACKKSILCGGGVPADPPPDVYAQIMEKLNSLSEVDPEMVSAAVRDYLQENPISEADPTVPAWAKAEQKPTYTAQEVGALPNTTVIPTDEHINSLIDQALGGGSSGAQGTGLWTLIREDTLEETVREYSVTENAGGGSFAYDQLMMTVFQNSTLASSGKLYFHFNGVQCGSPFTGRASVNMATMFVASRDGMITASCAYGGNVKETTGGLDNAPSGSTISMYFQPIAGTQKLESAKLSTSWWDGSNLQAGLIVRLWGRNV